MFIGSFQEIISYSKSWYCLKKKEKKNFFKWKKKFFLTDGMQYKYNWATKRSINNNIQNILNTGLFSPFYKCKLFRPVLNLPKHNKEK